MRPTPKPANLDDFLSRYVAGESENKLSGELGVQRFVFARWLSEAGIERRGRSAAERIKWQSMDSAARAKQVSAAHRARRGQRDSMRVKRSRANTRQARELHVSPVEVLYANLAGTKGIVLTPQFACGPYNIDLADETFRIAVEICASRGLHSGRHAALYPERVEYILDQGWSVLVVWTYLARHPLGVGAIEQLVAMRQFASSEVSGRRQYRVILGDGERAPAAKRYFNTPAFIKSLGCA